MRAGALVASSVGLGAGALAPAGIAQAYTGSCVGPVGAGNILQVREFSLQDMGNGNSLATVEVYAAMSEVDAQAHIDRPGKEEASFRLWDEDPGFASEGRGSTDITPQVDEFYATIRLPDFRNGSTHQVESCRLTLAS